MIIVELASVLAAKDGVVVNGPNEGARRAAAARAIVTRGLESELAELRIPSSRTRFLEFGAFAAVWWLGGSLVMNAFQFTDAVHWAMRIGGTLAVAVALHALALLLHDGVHHTLFRHRVANRWAAVVLGGTVLMAASAYQAMHERHHVFLGDPRDPDEYHNYSNDRRLVFAMHYLRLVLGTFLYLLLIPILVAQRGDAGEKRRAFVEYGLLAAVYAALYALAPHDVLLHAWLIPIIPAGIIFNIRSLAAHGLTDTTDPFLASRSIRAHPLVAFLFRNENLHLEHHLFPEIPGYNLDRVHALVFSRMPRAATAQSYVGFLAQFVKQSLRLDETPIGVVHHDN
jgi:fatty acid desaturase